MHHEQNAIPIFEAKAANLGLKVLTSVNKWKMRDLTVRTVFFVVDHPSQSVDVLVYPGDRPFILRVD